MTQAAATTIRIGRNVRRLREAKGWLPSHLAERAGLAPARIHYLERGIHEPLFTTISKVAVALGVTIDELGRKPKR